MSKIMLIDAAHAEETRVVVLDGNRVEEFDFESAARKQLRGNIYLAKVTRVEPSLQAAFVEYGGNRHGFLAFSEIHPDYYQIPQADREALMREEAEEDEHPHPAPNGHGENGDEEVAESDGDDDMDEEVARRRRRLMRRYKIQEVIKRRQIMLVQVVKEERGNKGAALTSYLSLAGRYGVLMPNTPRGGGISRKITNATDRKRLKTIVQGLDVPAGVGLIIRTAGAKRTKVEIQRDYEYLMRAWEDIRETTMNSIAPAQIYAEEDLVKRAVRDMYDKDMDGIIVEGDRGYKDARDIMRMLMPSQAKKVTRHTDPTPLFVKHGVEAQLSQIYTPVVPLKSGGYLVINQTEALVAIDVNSGKSTRERNIETTALKTNLEAAEEACRQLRLRDLAGLIVIDFIDMDESKNNRAVEKKMKDGLADDRARVQFGKISMFGLMEISRQRRRTGVLEGTTHVCERCGGTGRVRTAESSALTCLRAVELEAVRNGAGSVTLRVPRDVGLYILNEKRAYLENLFRTHGMHVTVLIDDAVSQAEFGVERTGHTADFKPMIAPPAQVDDDDDDFEDVEDEEEFEDEAEDEPESAEQADDEDEDEDRSPRDDQADGRGRRGRRRRRGHSGGERGGGERGGEDAPRPKESAAPESGESEEARRSRRRRGRRGGRRAREEVQTDGPYGWARMRAPDGDPYVWLDPAEVLEGAMPPVAPVRTEAPAQAAPASSGGEADIWVELPPREEGRGRGRRNRGRGRDRNRGDEAQGSDSVAPANDVIEEAAPVQPEPAVEAAPERAPEPAPEAVSEAPVKPARKPRKTKAMLAAEAEAAASPAVELAAEPEPAPVVAAAPKPAAPAEPDPNEISAPPPAPKKGWWRARQ